MTDISAIVDVTAPTAAPTAGWTKYLVSLCDGSGVNCGTAQECAKTVDPTPCTLTGLAEYTTHTVKVVASTADDVTLSIAGSTTVTTSVS